LCENDHTLLCENDRNTVKLFSFMANPFAVSDVWNGDSLCDCSKERLEDSLFLKIQTRKHAHVCVYVGWGAENINHRVTCLILCLI